MHKTRFVELNKLIKDTVISFITIVFLVSMGMAVYFGFKWSFLSVEKSIDNDFEKYCFHDLEASYYFGLNGEEQGKLSSIDNFYSVVEQILRIDGIDGVISQIKDTENIEGVIKNLDETDGYDDLSKIFDIENFDNVLSKIVEIDGFGDFINDILEIDGFENIISHITDGVSATRLKDSISKIDGVSNVEEINYGYESFLFNGNRLQTKIITLTETMDMPSQTEGKLPESVNEIALEKKWAVEKGLKIGDKVVFEDYGLSILSNREFTVTALIESPAYICYDSASYGLSPYTLTPLNTIMFVNKNAVKEWRQDFCSTFLIRADSLRSLSTFSDEYKEKSNSLADRIADKIENCSVKTRAYNTGVNICENSVAVFEKLNSSMGALLIAISQFVCFICIAGVVKKRKKLIGTKKTLGFKDGEIMSEYIFYSVITSFIGSVVGMLLGIFVLGTAFSSIINDSILFSERKIYFSFSEMAIVFCCQIAISIIVAFLACKNILRQNALSLLNYNTVQKSKSRWFEKSKVWKRSSLLTKTIVNNALNNKARVFATFISVACCTLLCVSALSVQNTVEDTFGYHYDKIQKYDSVLYCSNITDSGLNDISNILEEEKYEYAKLYYEMGALDHNGNGVCASLYVVDESSFSKLFSMYSLDGDKMEIKDGVYVSCAFATEENLKVGDSVKYENYAQVKVDLKISGIFEYYVQIPLLIMNEKTFCDLFGYLPNAKTFAVASNKTNCANAYDKLLDVDGFNLAYDIYSESRVSFDMMKVVCLSVLFVFLVLSLVMAFFVFLNLCNSFIDEKKYELISMMVNGYSIGKAKKYIITDILIFSIIGIILGNVLGQFLARMILRQLSSYTDFFLQGICVKGSLIGTIVSLLIVVVIAFISLSRIKKIKLTDCNFN